MAKMESFWLDNSEYRLTEKQAQEVDAKDAELPSTVEGNIQFNNWFRTFLRKNHIQPKNRRLSAYWTGTKNSTDDNVKMAVTLRAARTIVNVIDPDHKVSVEYKDNDGASTWGTWSASIPTAPIKDMPDLHEAINLESGFAIGEAIHSKYTRPLVNPEVRAFLDETPVNFTLADLIEDERGERLEMQENPGFKSYLQRPLDYLWEQNTPAFPEWEAANATEKLDGIATAVRHPSKRSELPASWDSVVDQALGLVDGYCESKRPMIIDAVNELKNLLDITPEDEQECKSNSGVDGEDNDGKSKLLPSDFVRDDKGLDADAVAAVDDLVEEEVERVPRNAPWIVGEKAGVPNITILKPKVTKPNAMPRIDGLLAKAKAALEFRKAVPRADERFMKSGELDEDELYRLMQGDSRVFRDITEDVVPSATVYLLVDMSGSMNSPMSWGVIDSETRVQVAQKFAHLLVSGMLSKPHVRVKVLGHTGDNDKLRYGDSYAANASFYRIWEEGDPLNRLSTIMTVRHGENYDGYAISWAGHLLSKEDADQKLLIVLSDGQPHGREYFAPEAEEHTAECVRAVERKGIDVLSVSISHDLSERAQQKMYSKYIPARGSGNELYSGVLRQLQRLLLKISTR